DRDKLGRFIQEAKAASALNHPNILTVYEIGEVDGKNYIATELIDGQTLREHLSHKEWLTLNTILKIGIQVAEALSAAHQAGFIHRDIKPENIMLRKDGYAKVLDFGLAKLSEPRAVATGSAGSEDATRVQVNTTPGMVMGTVSYMSPEQARGTATDARTDIWSLGIVLYEMLSGRVPFTGETVNHTIVSILEKEPKVLENVPDELRRIVRKTLTKEVEMRYQTARDLLIDLKKSAARFRHSRRTGAFDCSEPRGNDQFGSRKRNASLRPKIKRRNKSRSGSQSNAECDDLFKP
ncbi:MAG TPA: serine/threonine-protein kinase, partial [Acidobacteriota bacterium]|nr:serine/threonine-protein kinase [Acidobacteriota bacterium]